MKFPVDSDTATIGIISLGTLTLGMQAITTLHAQLCLATEKLETAQKSLIAQKNEMVIIEEEGRIKRNEMKELSELMVSSREEEKMGLDKLGELKLRTLPLELEYQKASGAMEVLPQAFQKLSDDFVLKSRRTMSQIECLLSQAIQESFWRNKIMMNLHHLNASRLRLREQTTVLNQSLVAEEEALNQQLAKEESSLAMVQACIETLEMKNGQLLSEKGGRDKPQSFASPYLSGHSMSPTNQVETSDEHPISSLKISNDCTTSDTTMDLNESVCHGCHKAGHFIGSCPECYKCQHCYKHHVRGKSCSSKYYSGVGSSIGARVAPIASVAPVPARIPATSSENLKPRELHLSYETPLTKSGAKHDSNNSSSSSCMSRSSPLQTDRSVYANISDPPLGNTFHRSLAPQYQQSQPQPPGQQQQKQWEQHTLQVEGHVTHTLTHTVTEELVESHHDFDRNRDRFRDGENYRRDTDERPWFQLMKRKRSVTETVKSNGNGNGAIDDAFDYDGKGADQRNESDVYRGQQDTTLTHRQHGQHINMKMCPTEPSSSRINTINERSSLSAKPYPGFRSGLAILLDAEK